MEKYSRWEILLAWLPSSDGSPPNRPHPCIYLGEVPASASEIMVIGITSDLTARRVGFSFNMPWAAGKHPETGLDKPSIAQADWRPRIAVATVRQAIGYTPLAQQRLIATCLAKIATTNKNRANR